MNKLAVFAASLLVFFGVMLWYLAASDWNGFLRSQIELQGSKAIKQTVIVERVDVKLTDGFAGVYGVSVSNPSQFKQTKAVYLGEISADIDVESLKGSPLIVEDITIEKPQIYVEFDKNGNNNISEILSAINSKIDYDKQAEAVIPEKKKKKSKKPQTMVTINSITLSEVALIVDATELNGKEYNLTIDNIQLNNIGGEEGVAADQLGSVIAQQLFAQLNKKADKQYKKVLKAKFKKESKRLLDRLKN